MAISHLSSGDVASVRPLGDELDQTSTTAYFKDEHLEVMRIFLPVGKRMAEHAVDGPVTLQCIEGEIDVVTGNTHKVIRSADLLYLAAGVPHALKAIRNSSLLVTIVLLRASDKPGLASARRIHHDNALHEK
jgi:quercetin dioxygenase-like cupin family protein